MQVKVSYAQTGPTTYRKPTATKRYAIRSYKPLVKTALKSPTSTKQVLREVATKIKSEIRQLASDRHDSILKDTVEAVKHFSWDTIYLELQTNVPTLMQLLHLLVKKPATSKPFISCMASQLLKDGHPKLGLMQRGVSAMLHKNRSCKQV